jgi:hypothetical protein
VVVVMPANLLVCLLIVCQIPRYCSEVFAATLGNLRLRHDDNLRLITRSVVCGASNGSRMKALSRRMPERATTRQHRLCAARCGKRTLIVPWTVRSRPSRVAMENE